MASDIVDISIPISALEEHFCCPICLGLMKAVTLTVCGHRFCEACIEQSIQSWRKCPVCNKAMEAASLISDRGFDALISVVEKEKVTAEDHNFQRLLKQISNSQGNDAGRSEVKVHQVSPIEVVLQMHLKKSLMEFELYSQELRRRTMMNMSKMSGGEESNVADLESLLETTLQSVTQAYDRFLSENLPTISLLPVNVDIRVQNKQIILPQFTFKPSTRLEELQIEVYRYLTSTDDPVISFPKDEISYILVRACAKGTVDVTAQFVLTLSEEQASPEFKFSDSPAIVLKDSCHPLLDYHISPGSEVIIYGPLRFVSDLPKQCFKQSFDSGERKMDYFNCLDCDFKWICRTCREICHKNHKMKNHVMGHQPGWACCYCPRKKKCTLIT